MSSTFVSINKKLVRFGRTFPLNNILHRSTRLAPFPLSFILANIFTRRIIYRFRLDSRCLPDYCLRVSGSPKHSNDHSWLDGLPGYLTLFTTHPFVHQSQFYIEKCLRFECSYYYVRFRPTVTIPKTTIKFHFVDKELTPSKYPGLITNSNKGPTHPLSRFLLRTPRSLWLTAIAGTELIRS